MAHKYMSIEALDRTVLKILKSKIMMIGMPILLANDLRNTNLCIWIVNIKMYEPIGLGLGDQKQFLTCSQTVKVRIWWFLKHIRGIL